MDWQESHHSKKNSDTKAHEIECWLACKLRPSWCNTPECLSSQWTPWKGWSWNGNLTLIDCKIEKAKTKSSYIVIIVITTLLGLILATNSLFNTSPSSLDLVLDIAYWSKIPVHLESLQLVFEIAYWSKILVDLESRPLKCSTWAWSDIQQGWHGPPPQVVTKTLQPEKVARIVNLVICYSLLIWPGWCFSYSTCCAFK